MKSNGRQADCFIQIRGWVFWAAVAGTVFKLIMIIIISTIVLAGECSRTILLCTLYYMSEHVRDS